MKVLVLPLLAGLLLAAGSALADHPGVGFGTGVAGPIITVPGATPPKGSLGIDLRTELVDFDAFSDAELAAFAGRHEHVHSTDWLLSPSLGISYAVTDDLALGLRLPYVYRNGIRAGEHSHLPGGVVSNTAESLGDSEGIGDLTLFGQYRFLRPQHWGGHASLLFGLKAPTGDTREKTRSGERFETEHQPGSGSWDPMLGVAVTRPLNGLSIDANVLHVFTTEGSQETELGDAFFYNLAVSWRLPCGCSQREHHHGEGHHHGEHHHDHGVHHHHLAWDLVLEANGEHRQKDEVGGEKEEHSGGNLLYLTPGLRLSSAGGMNVALSLGFPVWKDLNGSQSEPNFRTLLIVGAAF
jgi:hypothetical protein